MKEQRGRLIDHMATFQKSFLGLSLFIVLTGCAGNENVEKANHTAISQTSAPIEKTTPAETTPSNAPQPVREETRTEIITLEGMEEEIATKLFTSEKGYSVYYDVERFDVNETEGIVRIYPKGSLDVEQNCLTIEHANAEPEVEIASRMQAAESIFSRLERDDEYVLEMESGQMAALYFYGSDDNITQTVWLMSDDGAQGTYVFTITCINEAWEGFGTRFIYTIKSFLPQ